jgi:hypothetical protein
MRLKRFDHPQFQRYPHTVPEDTPPNIPAQSERDALWVREALSSGPAKPLELSEMDAAFERGAERAKARQAGK